MRDYFQLQYRMMNRGLRAIGLHPFVAYVLGLGLFVGISEFMFNRTSFAPYVLVLIAWSILLSKSERGRTEFLIIAFGQKKSKEIRLLENGLWSIPFLLMLLFHAQFLIAVLLLVGSFLLAVYHFNSSFTYTMPTPFYRNPFEFAVGFRNSFFVFIIAYLLTVLAIAIDNFNLGLFTMLLVFLVTLTFYVKPENEYYVWNYACKPAAFLFRKLKVASVYSAMLALPIGISLGLFYPAEINSLLLFAAIGFGFLWTLVLAKYSAYPNELHLPEGLLLALCIYFPPLLLGLLPFFYIKSVRKLNVYLK